MTREARRPTLDPDVGLHALNFAWSLGFQRALGADPDATEEQRLDLRSAGATAAMRDQYYQGIRDGRRLRAAMLNQQRRAEAHGGKDAGLPAGMAGGVAEGDDP